MPLPKGGILSVNELLQLLPRQELTIQHFLYYFFWGAAGTVVRIAYYNLPLQPPSFTEDKTGVRLNAVGELIVGGFVGALVDTNITYSTLAGLMALTIVGMVLESKSFAEPIVRMWLKNKGNEDE